MNSEPEEQRVEFKYIINSKNLNRVIDHVSKNNYFFIKQYEDRKVNSLYFDSAKLSELNNTLDGSKYEKNLDIDFTMIFQKIEGQWELKEKIGINTSKKFIKRLKVS